MSALYWRIYITDNAGAATTDIGEIEMRASVGGIDQCSGGTAIASSYYNASYVPANAFDNNTGTAWATASPGAFPSYIGYQFASPVVVAQVMIRARSDTAVGAPKDFEIQYSDNGSTWTTAKIVVGETGWSTSEARTYSVFLGYFEGTITESLGVTAWLITATRTSDGFLCGSAVSTGSTYHVDALVTEPCNLILSPKIDRAWITGITPALGEFWVPSNPDTTPRLYECTTSGAVGGSEPTWPTSGTVNDGSAVWTFVANLPTPKSLGPRIPS